MKSVFELIVRLSSPSRARRERAAGELHAVVRGLAARINMPPRSRAGVIVPRSAREDVAGDVMLALVENGEAIVGRMIGRNPQFARVRDDALDLAREGDRAEAHRAAEAYIRRMVATRWLTLMRGRRESRKPLDESRVPAVVLPEPDAHVERARYVTDVALEVVATRPDIRETFDEMLALATDDVTMDACVDREVGAAASPATRRAARDRLQQRHRRLRVALCTAIEALRRDGEFDADDAQLGRRFVERVLNRSPKGHGG